MVNNFERCVLKVKSKQSKSCKSKNWKGKDCVNPWAVCHVSVDGTNTEQMIRGGWYQIRSIDGELRTSEIHYGVFSERLSEDIYAFTNLLAEYNTPNGRNQRRIDYKTFNSNLYYFYLLSLDDGGKSKRKSKSRKSKRKSKSRKSKRKSKSRKSKRKSVRKSKRKSVRKSRKSKSSSKSSGRCEKSYLKKYITRPGPPYPAQNCKYSIRTGNDGNIYRSIPNKNGVFSWKKV